MFSRRQLLPYVGVSLLLHSAVVVYGSRPLPSTPTAAADTIAFEAQEPELARAVKRVALVGERPSGRGHAPAGSNARRRGAPWSASRAQPGVGRSDGTGTAGATNVETGAASARVGDDAALAATPATDSEVAIPPPSAPRATSEDVTDPPPRPAVDADRAFDELARAQTMRLAKGDGGGLAGFGSGKDGTGFGLHTDLSGEYRPDSRVATAPVIVQRRPVECELPGTLRLQAIVRVLVTRDGTAAVPRLLQPSASASFDRCAVSYVLALRFSPGMDAGGKLLDVWMNVRVSPSTVGHLLVDDGRVAR